MGRDKEPLSGVRGAEEGWVLLLVSESDWTCRRQYYDATTRQKCWKDEIVVHAHDAIAMVRTLASATIGVKTSYWLERKLLDVEAGR